MLKSLAVLSMVAMGLVAYQDVDLEGVKCVVNGERAANASHSAEYMDGTVYFCCKGCLGKFNADQELDEPTMNTKANHQLVVTEQYVQKGCPFSGGKVNPEQVVNVGGAEVGFCCGNCKGKVENAEDLAAKAALVFSPEAFEKGFEKKMDLDGVTCPISGRQVNAEQVSTYMDSSVYFCCGGCKSKFEENNEKFVVKSNHQLVATGQFTQTACPFSGGDMNEAKTVEVGGVDVAMCCGNCVKKVNNADSVDAKAELLFSAKAFETGFEKNE